ncbi:MAG: hypothetical protein CMK09_16350 [Ponticaulis sp.]|nr:hypothetical protein [Ponticaulis sp.]|tara:strand:- start:44287 stop:44583 length:297 start_codon:yes stop_codon:yes gene_type:complete
MVQFIGLLAACLTTLSFLPQAVLIIRTRETAGISFTMYLMFSSGVAAWLVYGIFRSDLPVILANFVTLILASIVLGLKGRDMLNERATAKAPRPQAPD